MDHQHQAHEANAHGITLIASLWWVASEGLKAIRAGAPPWSLVPPIVLALAALVNAGAALTRARRHRAEAHP